MATTAVPPRRRPRDGAAQAPGQHGAEQHERREPDHDPVRGARRLDDRGEPVHRLAEADAREHRRAEGRAHARAPQPRCGDPDERADDEADHPEQRRVVEEPAQVGGDRVPRVSSTKLAAPSTAACQVRVRASRAAQATRSAVSRVQPLAEFAKERRRPAGSPGRTTSGRRARRSRRARRRPRPRLPAGSRDAGRAGGRGARAQGGGVGAVVRAVGSAVWSGTPRR